HRKDNRALLSLVGGPAHDPLPKETVVGEGFTMWHSDIGAIVRKSVGDDDWQAAARVADESCGHAGDLQKNAIHIAEMLSTLWDRGHRCAALQSVCEAILDPADSVAS